MTSISDGNPYHESSASKKKQLPDYNDVNVSHDLSSTYSKKPILKLDPNLLCNDFLTVKDNSLLKNNFIKNESENKSKTSDIINVSLGVNSISHMLCKFILYLNIFLPGIGTITAGCYDKDNRSKYLKYGIVQLLTACIIIGWVWAIIFSIELLDNVKNNY
jgi:hypothetical protein